jgi:hypothetical protein
VLFDIRAARFLKNEVGDRPSSNSTGKKMRALLYFFAKVSIKTTSGIKPIDKPRSFYLTGLASEAFGDGQVVDLAHADVFVRRVTQYAFCVLRRVADE